MPDPEALTVENIADLTVLTREADLATPAESGILTEKLATPAADEKRNQILDLLQFYIPDILSYSCKRMPSQCLLETQASSWLITLST